MYHTLSWLYTYAGGIFLSNLPDVDAVPEACINDAEPLMDRVFDTQPPHNLALGSGE